jgi:hypothetical protein
MAGAGWRRSLRYEIVPRHASDEIDHREDFPTVESPSMIVSVSNGR